MQVTYENKEVNCLHISLHDCHADKMSFKDGTLSFEFSDGFWVLTEHPKNESEHVIRTDTSRVDFQIIDEEIDGIEIYVFKKGRNRKVIREEWETEKFISAVNSGDFRIEFLYEYKCYQSRLFKCCLWFDEKPCHYECEIILYSENTIYLWNNLRYDCVW